MNKLLVGLQIIVYLILIGITIATLSVAYVFVNAEINGINLFR